VLYRALGAARERWETGERAATALLEAMRAILDAEPLAAVDYAAVADPETFGAIEGTASGPVLLLLAVRLGSTRLIDNLRLEP
jgi:pantoate--beta-alanine ligase